PTSALLFVLLLPPPGCSLFPYTTLFRSHSSRKAPVAFATRLARGQPCSGPPGLAAELCSWLSMSAPQQAAQHALGRFLGGRLRRVPGGAVGTEHEHRGGLVAHAGVPAIPGEGALAAVRRHLQHRGTTGREHFDRDLALARAG